MIRETISQVSEEPLSQISKELRKFLKRYEIAKQCDHSPPSPSIATFWHLERRSGTGMVLASERGAAIRSQLLAWWEAEINPKRYSKLSPTLSDEDEFPADPCQNLRQPLSNRQQ